jgi:hypothetical protein
VLLVRPIKLQVYIFQVYCLLLAFYIYQLSWSVWTALTKYLRLGNF